MSTVFRWLAHHPTAMISLCLPLYACPVAVADDDKEVESKVVSVALFKNGLAIVKRQVTLPGAGVVRVANVPEPVHGTFFVESNGPLEARVEQRRIAIKRQPTLGQNLQDELTGLKVTIYGKNSKTPVTGTVVSIPKRENEPEDASTSPLEWTRNTSSSFGTDNTNANRFLLIKTEKGISYVDINEIASVEAEGSPKPEPIMENRPVLLLDAGAKSSGAVAQISYLAHGISWAPSYKVVLTDAKRMTIEQNAVIKNELMDLSDTEVSVISGYPSVPFGHVVSPLAATQTWARFFQQLGNPSGNTGLSNSIMAQNMIQSVGNNRSGDGGGSDPTIAPNMGDTIDLHYHSIGKRSLKKGDAISLSTGTAQVNYERIVQWTIPDNRDQWGQPTNNRNVDPNSGEPLQDDIWDALKFKNMLPFPMTSAPAMVMTGSNFSGQGQVLWTNKNDEATLRVNKALSIRARQVEYENQVAEPAKSDRDVIDIGGRRFRKVIVNGELRLNNSRATETKMIIKRQFSGDYLKGDDSPKIDLREEGVWTVNKRNELQWTIVMKPSEERTVKFQYAVLVNF
jgi:hypothetical protein